MPFRSALVVHQQPSYREERLTMDALRKALEENGIRSSWLRREKASQKDAAGKDLVISLGGDGTFLGAARLAKEGQPLLGVNADVSRKEGFLLRANRRNVGLIIGKVADGRYALEKLDTVEAHVNGKLLPVRAMNEFFVGADKPYLTARYEVLLGKRKETHRSSGLLVATQTGMHAWAGSAVKRNLAVREGEAGYVIREPYQHKLFSRYRILQGKLKKGERITFISKMARAIVVADSLSREFAIKRDDRVTFSLSDKKMVRLVPR